MDNWNKKLLNMNENKCYSRISCALSYCEIFNKRYFLPITVVLFFFFSRFHLPMLLLT